MNEDQKSVVPSASKDKKSVAGPFDDVKDKVLPTKVRTFSLDESKVEKKKE